MLRIYNTLSRRKEDFQPREGNRVKIFVCGPTVYDDSHIGHARTYIAFDMITRYLQYKGYSTFYLQNITDVDDKIIRKAKELEVDPLLLAREYEKKYLEDMERLGVVMVNLYARATEHMPQIISQIKTLLEKGYAYETVKGVYFDESKFPDFGKLSQRIIEDLDVHRVEADKHKRNPGDFALWKKKDNPPLWDSPWGKGRPGWHIEDTAISEEYFGYQYDIHGGGLDLIFPHHEAEIAQMEAASGKKPMVKYWMHTGFLTIKDEKMSKSLGNYITIANILKDYKPEVFRFFVLSTHYRSPINFNEKVMNQAQKSYERINKILETINKLMDTNIPGENGKNSYYKRMVNRTREDFINAMDNDFNTPLALSIIFDLIKQVNRDINNSNISKKSLMEVKILIEELCGILGLNLENKTIEDDLSPELLDLLLEVRDRLREKKDWEISDMIRSRLRDLDIIIEDQ